MKTKIISHNYTGNSFVLVFQGEKGVQTKIAEKTHINWTKLMQLYKSNKIEEMIPLMDVIGAIGKRFDGKFVVKNGKIFYNGEEVGGYLVDRILFFLRELPNQANRLIKFAENLYQNPSKDVINQLYKFLEHKNMPITEDGCFLAYKGVQQDYYSLWGGDIKVIRGTVNPEGKIFNGVGEVIEVEREQVCANSSVGCAKGIHCGSWKYADGYKNGGRIVIVKVNPRDAVSVPNDENFQKLRCCAYEVIGEEDKPLEEIKNSNFEKVQKVKRDAHGRFVKQ